MDNFQIETAQNVTIQQNVAGIGDRILAYLVDGVIVIAYWIASLFALGAFGVSNEDSTSLMVFYMVLGIPTFLYHLLFETLWGGRSPGKAAFNLRVVKIDGSKPGLGSFFVRWIMRIIDISLTSGGVAVLTILLNGKGQRLGDLGAGTTVINEKKRVRLSHTFMEDIPENYQAKYPQVTVFSDRDIQTVKTVFLQAKQKGNHNVIVKLSHKLSDKMQIIPEEKPIIFIEKVLKDYNFYTQQ